MKAYLLRLNVTANLTPYRLVIRDDCYGSSASFTISESQVSLLYRAQSPRVTVLLVRGVDVVSKTFCLKQGCNKTDINLIFNNATVPPPPSAIYDFLLSDRNYGMPLDGTLNLSN